MKTEQDYLANLKTSENHIEELFAAKVNKYYTLWKAIITTEDSFEYHHVIFLQNISKDEETYKKRFPNIKFNSSWKHEGSCSWKVDLRIDKTNSLPYGKYRGINFQEIDDFKYLAWAYTTNLVNDDNRENLLNWMISNKYVISEGNFILLDDLRKKQEKENKGKLFKEFAENRKEIKLKCLKNLKSDGTYTDPNLGITFHFKNYKQMNYCGIFYSLPKVNEKAVRIKNKLLNITDFEIYDDGILINEFELVK